MARIHSTNNSVIFFDQEGIDDKIKSHKYSFLSVMIKKYDAELSKAVNGQPYFSNMMNSNLVVDFNEKYTDKFLAFQIAKLCMTSIPLLMYRKYYLTQNPSFQKEEFLVSDRSTSSTKSNINSKAASIAKSCGINTSYPTGSFDIEAVSGYVIELQLLLGLEPDGVFGFATLYKLDQVLASAGDNINEPDRLVYQNRNAEIKYTIFRGDKALEYTINETMPVVLHDVHIYSDIFVYTSNKKLATINEGITLQGVNDGQQEFVFVTRIIPGQNRISNWCEVIYYSLTEPEKEVIGYVPLYREVQENGNKVRRQQIWYSSLGPVPGSKLYRIQPNDNILKIASKFYTSIEYKNVDVNENENDTQNDRDKRYYANFLLYANNPEGKSEVGKDTLNVATGKFDLIETRKMGIFLKSSANQKTILDYVKDYVWEYKYSLVTPILTFIPGASAWGAWHAWADHYNDKSPAGAGYKDYDDCQVNIGFNIWIPPKEYALSCYRQVGSGSIGGEILNIKNETQRLYGEFSNTIKEAWPENTGFQISGDVGGKVGLSVEGGGRVYISREKADLYDTGYSQVNEVLVVRKMGYVKAGFQPKVKKPNLGLLMGVNKMADTVNDAGGQFEFDANLELTLRLEILEEFVFDFENDYAVANALMSVHSLAEGVSPLFKTGGGLGKTVLNYLLDGNINFEEYRTKFECEVKGEVGASGAIVVGAGGEMVVDPKSTNFDYTEFNLKSVLKKLMKKLVKNTSAGGSVGGKLSLNIGAKLAINYPKHWSLVSTSYIPKPTEIDASVVVFRGGVLSLFSNYRVKTAGIIPLFSGGASYVNGFEAGVKLNFKYVHDEFATDFEFPEFEDVSFYYESKDYDDDFYTGGGSQYTLTLDNLSDIQNVTLSNFTDYIKKLEIRKIVDFKSGLFAGKMDRMQFMFENHLDISSKFILAPEIKGLVDIHLEIESTDLVAFFNTTSTMLGEIGTKLKEKVKDATTHVTDGVTAFIDLDSGDKAHTIKYVLNMFTSDWISDTFQNELAALCNVVDVKRKVIYASIGFKAGGEIALVAGVKLMGSFEVFYINDLVDFFQSLYEYLKSKGEEFEFVYKLPFAMEIEDGIKKIEIPQDCKIFEQLLRIE